jgi:hypothetical protein
MELPITFEARFWSGTGAPTCENLDSGDLQSLISAAANVYPSRVVWGLELSRLREFLSDLFRAMGFPKAKVDVSVEDGPSFGQIAVTIVAESELLSIFEEITEHENDQIFHQMVGLARQGHGGPAGYRHISNHNMSISVGNVADTANVAITGHGQASAGDGSAFGANSRVTHLDGLDLEDQERLVNAILDRREEFKKAGTVDAWLGLAREAAFAIGAAAILAGFPDLITWLGKVLVLQPPSR